MRNAHRSSTLVSGLSPSSDILGSGSDASETSAKSASARHSIPKAQWWTKDLVPVLHGGASQGINVRLRRLRKGESVGGTAYFFNKPFELCRRSDLQPTTWTLRAHNERVWHTTRQQDEGTRAGLPPILAAHLFALPDSRPGWDDREVDGFRLQWLCR
jgi:hypothetical protein